MNSSGKQVEGAGDLTLIASQSVAFENGLVVEGSLEVVNSADPCV